MYALPSSDPSVQANTPISARWSCYVLPGPEFVCAENAPWVVERNARRPEVRPWLQIIRYLPDVVSEGLRLFSLVGLGLPRVVSEAGLTILGNVSPILTKLIVSFRRLDSPDRLRATPIQVRGTVFEKKNSTGILYLLADVSYPVSPSAVQIQTSICVVLGIVRHTERSTGYLRNLGSASSGLTQRLAAGVGIALTFVCFYFAVWLPRTHGHAISNSLPRIGSPQAYSLIIPRSRPLPQNLTEVAIQVAKSGGVERSCFWCAKI